MHLHNIYSKLQHARNLLLRETPTSIDLRGPLAELDDVIRDIGRELIDVAPFPLICSCEKKGTAQEHKQTTRRAAEQAYANFRRYSAVHTLSDIENTGGFDCVEIRALLFGLNPFSLKNAKKFSLEHPDIKVDSNGA
jgi:hypothetical protein